MSDNLAAYISTVEDALPETLCAELRAFLDEYDMYAEGTNYGDGENTASRKIQLVERFTHADQSYVQAYQAILDAVKPVLTDLVNSSVIPTVYPISAPVFAPIQVRKMLGPTRKHSDNVSPFSLFNELAPQVGYRVVTLILTLSDTTHQLIFPKQQHSVKLKRGALVTFPPYWMFEHYTTGDDSIRYSLTTWLNETRPLVPEECLPLRPRSA